jgi:hypothetical protein
MASGGVPAASALLQCGHPLTTASIEPWTKNSQARSVPASSSSRREYPRLSSLACRERAVDPLAIAR